MYLLVFLGIIGVAIAQTSTDLTHCPASVPRNNYLKVYGGKCLQFVITEKSWNRARTDCKSRGGDLVTIKDAGKQAFVYNTVKTLHWRYNGLWIGGSDIDREGIWVWVDRTPVSYGNWHPGQGATAHHGFFFSSSSIEDCAQMRIDDRGRWHDYSCGRSYSYVCEYAFSSTTITKARAPHTTQLPVSKTTPRPQTTVRPKTTPRPRTTPLPRTTIKPTTAQTSTDVTHCPASVPRNNYLKVYGGKCIQFVVTERSWPQASADCKSRGGDLVMIKNAGKQAFVYNTLKSLHWRYSGVWIGGSDRDQEGTWMWVDGSHIAFGNWHPGQGPTHNGFFFSSSIIEDCAEMRLDDGGRWHDYPCGGLRYSYSYVCEYAISSSVSAVVHPHTTPLPVTKSTARPRTTSRPQTTASPRTSIKPSVAQTSTDVTHCPASVPRNNYLKVYNGKCIQFVLTEKSWPQASADCKSRGGDLVMIKNAGKQAFVYNTLKSLHWRYNGVWIGGSDRDQEGTWMWVDGSHIAFGNWHPGQGPTHNGFFFSSSIIEDCAEMRLDDGGKWHDYPCGGLRYSYSYVCEYAISSTGRPLTTLRPQPTSGPRTSIKPPVVQTSTDLTHCPGTVPRNNYLKVYGGKCVQFVLTERSWTKASADCKSRGGTMVMIKDAGKQAFVYNTLKSLHWRYHGVWIGGSDRDKEGSWVWVDGSRIDYGNWHPGQGPTTHNGFFFSSSTFEDCAEMRLDDGGKWHDYPCGGLRYSYSYICEYALSSTAVSVVVPSHTTPRPVPKTTPRPARPSQTATPAPTARLSSIVRQNTSVRPRLTSYRPQTSRKPAIHSIVPKLTSTKPGILYSTNPNIYVVPNGANRHHFSAAQHSNIQPKKSTNETGIIVGVVVGGLVLVALLAGVFVVRLRRNRSAYPNSPMSIDNKLYGMSPSHRDEAVTY